MTVSEVKPPPSAFRCFLTRLGPFDYTLHNVVAHPLSEIAYLIGLKRLSRFIHDETLPADHDEEH